MVGPGRNIGSRMKPHISGKEATYVPLEAAKRGPMRVGAVTAARQAAVAATGKTPLDVMLANMRWADKGAARPPIPRELPAGDAMKKADCKKAIRQEFYCLCVIEQRCAHLRA